MENNEKVLINQIPDLVMFDHRLKPLTRLIWGYLNSLSWEKGYCYASNKHIADKFQTRELTIKRAISELKETEYIKVIYDKREINNTKRKIYMQRITSNSNINNKPLNKTVLIEKINRGSIKNDTPVVSKMIPRSYQKRYPGSIKNDTQVLTLSINSSSNSTAVTQKNVSLTTQPSFDCEVTGEPVSLEVKGKGEILTNNELNTENMQETPSQQQVIEFFNSNGIGQEPATYWFNKLSKANWLDSGGQKIAHWRNYALYYINGLKSKQTSNQPLTSNGPNQPVTSQQIQSFEQIANQIEDAQRLELGGFGEPGFRNAIYKLITEVQKTNHLTETETISFFLNKIIEKNPVGDEFRYQTIKSLF